MILLQVTLRLAGGRQNPSIAYSKDMLYISQSIYIIQDMK
ncbi:hypothetical protein ACVIDN_006709 [Rhizobium brockwellii]|jgi:hypothetical protein